RGGLPPVARRGPPRGSRGSAVQFAGDGAQHRRDPTSHLGVRAVTAAQLRLDGRLEHVDHVLDHPVEFVGRATTATAGVPGLRDRVLLVDADPQCRWSTTVQYQLALYPLTR